MRDLSDYDPIWRDPTSDWALVRTAKPSPPAQDEPESSHGDAATPAGSPGDTSRSREVISDLQLINRLTGETHDFYDETERTRAITYLLSHGMRPIGDLASPAEVSPPSLPVVPVIDDAPLPIGRMVAITTVLILLIAILAVLRVGPFTEEAWNQQFGTVADDRTDACAIAPNGNVFAAGVTTGDLFGHNVGGDDVWVAMYDPSGGLKWARHLGSAGDDLVTALATDRAGNVVVVGGTEGALFGKNGGGTGDGEPHHDIFMLKLDTFGKIVWVRQFASKGDEIAKAVAITPTGTIFVAGDTDHQIFVRGNGGQTTQGSSDIFLAKFEPTGVNTWAVQYGGAIPTYADSIALDKVANCYIAGRTSEAQPGRDATPTVYVARFDVSGRIKWSAQAASGPNNFPASATTDEVGNVYVAGDMMFGRKTGREHPGVIEMDPSGKVVRRVEFTPPAAFSVSSALPDKRGGVILSGATTVSIYAEMRGKYDAIVSRYAPDGRLLWGNQVGSPGNDVLTGVTLGKRGLLYTFGKTDGGLFHEVSGGDDAVLMRLDRGGHIADRGYWGEVAPKPPKKKGVIIPRDPADL